MKDLEILAPAGAFPQLEAAVRSGADAVYIGLKKFSARASAVNFDFEELKKAVKYCHNYGVKLHVTLNTLVYESEYAELLDEIKEIAEAGADAVIVQDLAVLKYIKAVCPSLSLHASTQMAVHNTEGALEAYKLGFSRVVLARELTLDEIRNIRKNTPEELELEAFIHGALCMSASGRCELSAMLGGRSGNRGQCAQPCRLAFSCGNMKNVLSLKDMSHISYIAELRDAGVCSVKIEGRMKRPEYVAAAVNACLSAREGKDPNTELLKDIFSRSGFTDGYLMGKRTRDMFGIRTKEDVESSKCALSKAAELYRRERQRVAVKLKLTLTEEETRLELSDGTYSVCAVGCGANACTSGEKPTDEAFAGQYLFRFGGTPFLPSELLLENPERLSQRASVLNALRREASEKLSYLRENSVKYEIFSAEPKKYAKNIKSCGETYVKSRTWKQISDFADSCDKIILPIDEILKNREEIVKNIGDVSRLAAELPSLIYDFSPFEEKIKKIKETGTKTLFCDNIGSVRFARENSFDVIGGFGLNITNSDSLQKYFEMGAHECVLSPEIPFSAAEKITGESKTGIFAYGYLPLMLLRSCPVRAAIGCEKCGGKGEITDRYGIKFKISCHDRIFSELLNSVPHYIGDRSIPADFALLSFTHETREECNKVFRAFVHGDKIKNRTTGLYIRT